MFRSHIKPDYAPSRFVLKYPGPQAHLGSSASPGTKSLLRRHFRSPRDT